MLTVCGALYYRIGGVFILELPARAFAKDLCGKVFIVLRFKQIPVIIGTVLVLSLTYITIRRQCPFPEKPIYAGPALHPCFGIADGILHGELLCMLICTLCDTALLEYIFSIRPFNLPGEYNYLLHTCNSCSITTVSYILALDPSAFTMTSPGTFYKSAGRIVGHQACHIKVT